jgi:3-dehydro-L-gulonate 2-dehydrogenase
VLDMAMSQFSFGALESYRRRDELLPVVGGYDSAGELTRNAAEIEKSQRPLPIGFWKGSGLSVMLDLVASVLAGGKATHEIQTDPLRETELSQVFLAFDPSSLGGRDAASLASQIVEHLQSPSADGERPRYPGERTLETRRRNLAEGIPVDAEIWRKVKSL